MLDISFFVHDELFFILAWLFSVLVKPFFIPAESFSVLANPFFILAESFSVFVEFKNANAIQISKRYDR
ncbi:hypothetical protein CGC56_00575 [Capnocytophaga canimorsus]|uniref:Uncharacterized protein n=1 Tax=Capnocytophaga canimorsus TaxID=28188 RepID=A0A250G3A7_9FLAO|nr:hypothetical protein CGC56_00575 [Capnocytophaga canimorsus]